MSEDIDLVDAESVDRREYVVTHARPREVAILRVGRISVASKVECVDVKRVRESPGHWLVGPSTDPSGVGDQIGIAPPTEVVDRDRHTLRRGGTHRPVLAASPRLSGRSGSRTVDRMDLAPNAERFSGFADLYDRVRPTPPPVLADIVCTYAAVDRPEVVDLGSGSGLSTRWIASWASSVIGVEPSADMRAVAAGRNEAPSVSFIDGWSHDTGLPDDCADVVIVSQALHWMEPGSTFGEAARLLRPGGVFAALDCDWPPSVGSARAEAAWQECRARVRAYDERLAAGARGDSLTAPLPSHVTPLPPGFARDAPRGRTMSARSARMVEGRAPRSHDRQRRVLVVSRGRRLAHRVG